MYEYEYNHSAYNYTKHNTRLHSPLTDSIISSILPDSVDSVVSLLSRLLYKHCVLWLSTVAVSVAHIQYIVHCIITMECCTSTRRDDTGSHTLRITQAGAHTG